MRLPFSILKLICSLGWAVLILSKSALAQNVDNFGYNLAMTTDTDVNATGTTLLAFDFHDSGNASQTTVNGVTFSGAQTQNGVTLNLAAAGNAPIVGSSGVNGSGFSAAYTNILATAGYRTDNTPLQISFTGLKAGESYRLQILGAFAAGTGTETLTDPNALTGSNTGLLAFGPSGVSAAHNGSFIGVTFTESVAANGTFVLSFAPSNSVCVVNAINLRDEGAAGSPTQPGELTTGPGGSTVTYSSVTMRTFTPTSTVASDYYIYTPTAASPSTPLPVVIFMHGYSAVPGDYQDWIYHIVQRGNIVIYPVYETSSPFTPAGGTFTSNSLTAIENAFNTLTSPGQPVTPNLSLVGLVGHSMGGLLCANLAADMPSATYANGTTGAQTALPIAKAVMCVSPGVSYLEPLANLSKIPSSTLLLTVAGDDDTVVGNTDAINIFKQSTNVPIAQKNYVTMISDSHGSPALDATHYVPCTAPDYAPDDPYDFFCTWKLWDALSSDGFYGIYGTYALGNGTPQTFMGYWSDGIAVQPLHVETSLTPIILMQPTGQVATIGQPATFSVTTGGGYATYQWEYQTSPSASPSAISGATSSSYTIPTVAASNEGLYSVVVTSPLNSVTSSKAALIAATSLPMAQTVTVNQAVTFSVSVPDATSYQWDFNGAAIAGATGSSYTIPYVTSANAGNYSVVVSDANGMATTQSVSLTVNLIPTDTPTLPEWGLIMMGGLLLLAGAFLLPEKRLV